jgi:hypothetical protein
MLKAVRCETETESEAGTVQVAAREVLKLQN